MSILSKLQYIYHRIWQNAHRGHEVYTDRQQGFVSLAALCLLLVMLGFGLALLYFVRAAWSDNMAYQQEMNLRLAAEGAVEQQARIYEQGNPDMELVPFEPYQSEQSSVAMPGLKVTVKPERLDAKLLLTGYARWQPVGSWVHEKVVRGLLRKQPTKEGIRYVWCGWTT